MHLHLRRAHPFPALLLAAALAGCPATGDDDDATPDPLTQTSILADAEADDCTPNLYWPAALSHFPLSVFAVDAPTPPYEITGFSGTLFDLNSAFAGGRPCRAAHGVHVFAFLLDGDATDLATGADGLPTVDILAEATLSTTADGDWVEAEVTLPTPIRVEDDRPLWLGFDDAGDSGAGDGGCIAGCEVGGPQWRYFAEGNNFNADAGWEELTDANLLLRVHVRH